MEDGYAYPLYHGERRECIKPGLIRAAKGTGLPGTALGGPEAAEQGTGFCKNGGSSVRRAGLPFSARGSTLCVPDPRAGNYDQRDCAERKIKKDRRGAGLDQEGLALLESAGFLAERVAWVQVRVLSGRVGDGTNVG